MNSGAFKLEEELGRGAVGRVVRVRRDDGSLCAGKILHESHREDAEAAARFESEARILSGISHPNMVEVHGIELIDGAPVMLMELVSGDDLATLLATSGPLETERLVEIAKGICAGLGAAHRAGLVHRDLKPQNILLTESGEPKIADFGMARAASFAGIEASAFAVAGTPDYMAPECIDPLAVDVRSDLYSLGCMLYEMASGAPPFVAATSFAVLEAHRTGEVPPLPESLPKALSSLILALLEKSPAERPQSALDVLRQLENVAAGQSTALALAGGSRIAATGRCAECGATLIESVAVCFGCASPRTRMTPGKHFLVVTGPGENGAKLDAKLRLELLGWLDDNPSLGLDTSPLAKKTPRLPFSVVENCSEESVRSLADSLEALGLSCAVGRGSPYRHAGVRKKAWKLTGRIFLILAGSSIGAFSSTLGTLIPAVLGAEAVGSLVSGWIVAGSRVTKDAKAKRSQLPAAVDASVSRVGPVVTAMELARHRESLKGVVARVLSLSSELTASQLLASEGDLARVVDVALVSCARIDEIESSLSESDMRNPGPQTLEKMRERDRHSGLVLELTAFLDGLRARTAAAKGQGAGAARDEELAALQAHIAALEEVQAL